MKLTPPRQFSESEKARIEFFKRIELPSRRKNPHGL
jgi:hypothetical protein